MKRAALRITDDGQQSFDGVTAWVDCRVEWDAEAKKWKASAEDDAWTVHDDNSNRAAIRCLANRLGVGETSHGERANAVVSHAPPGAEMRRIARLAYLAGVADPDPLGGAPSDTDRAFDAWWRADADVAKFEQRERLAAEALPEIDRLLKEADNDELKDAIARVHTLIAGVLR